MKYEQIYIDPREALKGQVIARSEFFASNHYDLAGYKIVKFSSDPLSREEYKRAISLARKYYPECLVFDKNKKGAKFNAPRTSENIRLKVGEEFSIRDKDFLSRTFTIIEILALSGYQKNVCIQILKEVNLGKKLFGLLDSQTLSKHLEKYSEEKRLSASETTRVSDLLKAEVSVLKMVYDLRWYFSNSTIINPENEELYSRFVDFFLSYTKLYLNQGKKTGEFGYLEADKVIKYSEELKQNQAFFLAELISFLARR